MLAFRLSNKLPMFEVRDDPRLDMLENIPSDAEVNPERAPSNSFCKPLSASRPKFVPHALDFVSESMEDGLTDGGVKSTKSTIRLP